MDIILFAIVFIIILFLVLYFLLTFWFHDFSVRSESLEYFRSKHKSVTKVLFIYPHPDDETMISGGLVNRMARDKRFEITVVSTTHGEKGNELRPELTEQELGNLRKSEFEKAVRNLGVTHFEMWDFKDGKHVDQVEGLRLKVKGLLELKQFDVVVTYEKHGLYGHPDHIILSRVLTEIKNPNFRLLYATLPTKIMRRLHLPTSITLGDEIIKLSPEKITDPNIRISVIQSIAPKYFAARNYRSQNLSHGVPLWLNIGIMRFEYYFEDKQ